MTEADILNASILLVDDQQVNLQLLEKMLAQVGYGNVTSTLDPTGVAALHARHDYGLIVLDLQMPEMDGFAVMEALKPLESNGYLPVLVVTAEPAHKLRALQAGARDFVSKPFDMLEIQTRIRNMLEVRLLYREIERDNRKLEQIVAERTAELSASEARFKSLVELASDWYWEQDANGFFTNVSGPALEMLGLSEEATEGGSARSRWNERERADLDEKMALRRPFLDFVYSRVNTDGTEQFLQTSGEPKFDESGRFIGYRGIGMDVTNRVQNSSWQRHQELQRFRRAMDSTTHAILLLDRASMRFVDVNEGACRMFGYSREEFLGFGPGALTDSPEQQHEADYDRLIEGSAEGVCQLQLLRKDGSVLSVEVHRQATRTESGWMLVEVLRELKDARA